ncbi:hypothetical protein Tco_0859611 [Tanacetum coccineum]|uniref:Uncharacterized protein n=1 Tax=Tanacetum coccineum TaxID=301880 RepID=A0ABQ5BGG6_9ASTR
MHFIMLLQSIHPQRYVNYAQTLSFGSTGFKRWSTNAGDKEDIHNGDHFYYGTLDTKPNVGRDDEKKNDFDVKLRANIQGRFGNQWGSMSGEGTREYYWCPRDTDEEIDEIGIGAILQYHGKVSGGLIPEESTSN